MTTLDGYRELSKRDFALSSLSAFGLFRHQKIVLKRKPVKRMFALAGRKAGYLDLTFLTDAKQTARGAVDVSVRYFDRVGRRLGGAVQHQLFADPAHAAEPQRLWISPPKGAMFAELSVARALPGQKVALDGRLRLRGGAKPTTAKFDEILESRDLSAMAMVLAQIEDAGDLDRAAQILARMRTFSDDRHIVRKQKSLWDACRILAHGPNFSVPVATRLAGLTPEGRPTTYAQSDLARAQGRVPLGKALRGEALQVADTMLEIGGVRLILPPGEGWLGRLLVAAMLKNAVPDIEVETDWRAFQETPQVLGSYLRFEKGASFLETEGGQAVLSICQTATT